MSDLEDKKEQYLLEELPDEEVSALEKAIERDQELAKSVAEHRIIMERLEALRLRNKVQRVLKQSKPDNLNGNPRFSTRFLWILLAGLLSIAAAWWLYQNYVDQPTPPLSPPAQTIDKPKPPAPVTPVEMAEQHSAPVQKDLAKPGKIAPKSTRMIALAQQYHQGPMLGNIREVMESETSDSKTTIQLAAEQYELGNYRQSVDLLKPEKTVATDGSARFLRASARFQLGQYAPAAADFEVLHSSFMLQHEARWNYMLCQLAMGNMDKAGAMLNVMSSDLDFPFQRQALEIKAKLSSEGN